MAGGPRKAVDPVSPLVGVKGIHTAIPNPTLLSDGVSPSPRDADQGPTLLSNPQEHS